VEGATLVPGGVSIERGTRSINLEEERLGSQWGAGFRGKPG